MVIMDYFNMQNRWWEGTLSLTAFKSTLQNYMTCKTQHFYNIIGSLI